MLDEATQKQIDQKLERIVELVKIRADAYNELANLLMDNLELTSKPLVIVPLQELNKAPAPYIPRQSKETQTWVEHQTGTPRKRGEPCKECGSRGWRHFASCSQDGVAKKKVDNPNADDVGRHGRSILDEPEKITAVDWKEMKNSYDDGVASDMLKLSYPNYDPGEIKKAVKCDTYDKYVDA